MRKFKEKERAKRKQETTNEVKFDLTAFWTIIIKNNEDEVISSKYKESKH